MFSFLALAAIVIIPAALAALALDTIRAVERVGGYAGFEPTYRAYGA
jgi:hypothetical protein